MVKQPTRIGRLPNRRMRIAINTRVATALCAIATLCAPAIAQRHDEKTRPLPKWWPSLVNAMVEDGNLAFSGFQTKPRRQNVKLLLWGGYRSVSRDGAIVT